MRRAGKSSSFEIGGREPWEEGNIVSLAFVEPMSGPLQDGVSRGSAGVCITGAKLLE